MRQSVQDQFINFSAPFEGILDFMYLDVRGLVTTGMGNLIDTPGEAQRLPFFFQDDPARFATQQEIADDWQRVKARQDLAPQGGGVFGAIALLRISRQTIENMIATRLADNANILMTGTPEFSAFESWPADAQLGLLSMAWAMGAAFAQGGKFPSFRAACAASNFDTAAVESHMNEAGNPGLIPRNQADVILFTNAARVLDGGSPDLSLDTLWYPQILTPGIPPVGQPGASGWPRIQQNDNSPLVVTLQFLLNEHGIAVPVDGNFDAFIDSSVKDFQLANGLTNDGIVGRASWEKLIVTRRLRDSGHAVSAIQDRLTFWDVGLAFPVPGDFDADTDAAVRAFQTANGLTSDGVTGHDTWRALISF